MSSFFILDASGDFAPAPQIEIDPALEAVNPLLAAFVPIADVHYWDCWRAQARLRRELSVRMSWAIPSDEALELVARYAPITEVGAGTGYWAWLLRNRGVDVAASDACPPDGTDRNEFHPGATTWTEVARMDAVDAAAAAGGRALMLLWPPPGPMAIEAIRGYQGKHVIVAGEIGESAADHACAVELHERWREIECVALPSWDVVPDWLRAYERVG